MALTWNPALIQKAYGVIGAEMRAVGYQRNLTPNVGVARDPRFGRTGETYGEDPYLVSRMAEAAVWGLRGVSLKTGIMATLKHFAAYDETTGGKDAAGIDVSERRLREVFFPPFQAGIAAGAGSIMCAYHAINGMPCVSNRWLLTDVLKNEWGFDGFVCTDFICMESLYESQKVADSLPDAYKRSYEAGVDLHDHDMDEKFAERLAQLVNNGGMKESIMDEAVRRSLRAKFRLGLFDNPFVDAKMAAQIVGNDRHRAVSLQAARESLVLLKNDNGLLPLKSNISSLALIGPNIDNMINQMGMWAKEITPAGREKMVTFAEGLRAELAPHVKLTTVSLPNAVMLCEPVPWSAFTPDGLQGVGFKGEYWNGSTITGAAAVTRVDELRFDWSVGSPAMEIGADHFVARWSATLHPPVSGSYQFSLTGDDQYRFYVDDQLMTTGSNVLTPPPVLVNCEEGKPRKIRVEFLEYTGQARMILSAQMPIYPKQDVARAIAAAKAADATVLVLGDTIEMNGETHDRAHLDLTGYQQELAEAVLATGKPVAVVLINARPLTINWLAEHAPAILEAWNPGAVGGTAVAEALLGKYNPGGKLPITFPRAVGQLPVYYNQEPGWHGPQVYADGTPGTPLYPFGYGLSYTTFDYTHMRLDRDQIARDGKVQVSIDVRNSGSVRGDEVVQLYIHDVQASLVQPIKLLKDFRRISLDDGETKTVSFELPAEKLALIGRDQKPVVEAGEFEIMVGGNSREVLKMTLQITE